MPLTPNCGKPVARAVGLVSFVFPGTRQDWACINRTRATLQKIRDPGRKSNFQLISSALTHPHQSWTLSTPSMSSKMFSPPLLMRRPKVAQALGATALSPKIAQWPVVFLFIHWLSGSRHKHLNQHIYHQCFGDASKGRHMHLIYSLLSTSFSVVLRESGCFFGNWPIRFVIS